MEKTYSLYSLLNEKKILIPKIQRDYAQGREGKESVRKKFLEDIFKHLKNNETLFLDFVYGSSTKTHFYPLDGQQRLTTLWLVHWYISYKSNHLDDDISFLNNFSYDVRISSREFCEYLCSLRNDQTTLGVVDYIKSKPQFYSSWLLDPTISSMLRTLGGNSSTIGDNIEDVFKDCDDTDFNDFRTKLIESELVQFKVLFIGNEKLPMSDDLYVKMNARGKPLSDFENFKADIVNILKDKFGDESFSKKIDQTWIDYFWDFHKEKLGNSFTGNIDDSIFTFINRYLFCAFYCRDNSLDTSAADLGSDSYIKKILDVIYKDDSKKRRDSLYDSFDPYKDQIAKEDLDNIDTIINYLKNDRYGINSIINGVSYSFVDLNTSTNQTNVLIPEYDENNASLLDIKRMEEIVYFWAVAKFIVSFNDWQNLDNKYNRWIRVVRNIVENGAIDSRSAMVVVLQFINKIADECSLVNWDVVDYLSSHNVIVDRTRSVHTQFNEEIAKAQKISSDSDFEPKIVEAENYSFFGGTIRFLFTDENGDISWDDFDQKYENAKSLFNSDPKDDVALGTVQKFLALFNSLEDIRDYYFFTSIGFHNRNNCWKRNILCNETLYSKIHSFLMRVSNTTNVNYIFGSGNGNEIIKRIYDDKASNYKYRYHRHYTGCDLIYKERGQEDGIYLSSNRKQLCDMIHQLVVNNSISLMGLEEPRDYCNGYYWGIYLVFKYNDRDYRIVQRMSGNNEITQVYLYDGEKNVGNPYVVSDFNQQNFLNGISTL